MSSQYLIKFTSAYLKKYFKIKKLPYVEWDVVIDGVHRVFNNYFVIDSILAAQPEQQKMIADTLYELDANHSDINLFLKHLALEGNTLAFSS